MGNQELETTVSSASHCRIKLKSMEKEMATHSSILAWKNPWTEESGGLKSMGLHD